MAGKEIANGLEGIVVARTALSLVDGQAGRLVIRGYDVEEIAGRISFEEVFTLLRHGALPGAPDKVALTQRLGELRARAFGMIPALGDALEMPDPMDSLRASLGHIRAHGVPGGDAGEMVTAAAPVFSAAWYRTRRGEKPLAPRPDLPHARDFLRMAVNVDDASRAAGLDAYLVAVSDHGFNASTFTCRVVASTGSDLVSSCVAAVGALKGPLHGGAPGPVLDMLDAIASPDRAESWIDEELASGRRIMGMGHRIYRVRDPRAAVLEGAIERLETAGVKSPRLALARAVEHVAQGKLKEKYPSRSLAANVEFYTAVLLDTVGLPRELFSPAFGAARMAGWCAHFDEQRETGRLIRPDAEYNGPLGLKLN